MSWIRQAVRACTLGLHACCDAFARLSANHQIAWLRTVGEHWLAGQQDYYHRQHAINHRRYQKCHYGGLILAVAQLATGSGARGGRSQAGGKQPHVRRPIQPQSATQSAQSQDTPVATTDSHTAASEQHGWSARQPPHWLLVLSGSLAVAGVSPAAYGERRAFEDLARQYNRMSEAARVHSLGRAASLPFGARRRGPLPSTLTETGASADRECELADPAAGAPVRAAAGALRHPQQEPHHAP